MSTLQVDAAVVVPEETAIIAPHRRTSSAFVKEAPTAIQFVGPFVVSHRFDIVRVLELAATTFDEIVSVYDKRPLAKQRNTCLAGGALKFFVFRFCGSKKKG